jgi:hypothetical protein
MLSWTYVPLDRELHVLLTKLIQIGLQNFFDCYILQYDDDSIAMLRCPIITSTSQLPRKDHLPIIINLPLAQAIL